jgi:hypothetical protein
MIFLMKSWKLASILLKCNCFPLTFLTNSQSIHLYPHVHGQLQEISIWLAQKHPLLSTMIEALTNVDSYLSLTQLSIWNNNFFSKSFKPTIWLKVCNLCMQHNFPCNIRAKNEFYRGCSNNTFNSETKATSKVYNNYNKDQVVKLGLFGHISLEYCAYVSSPWPCTIIPVKVISNYPRLDIILLHTYNIGNIVFAWFNLVMNNA